MIVAKLFSLSGVRELTFNESTRKTYSSNFLMNGGDIFTLQKTLGYSDTRTTMVYAHLVSKHIAEMANTVRFEV